MTTSLKLVEFAYKNYDGSLAEESENFFFGHPNQNPTEVYSAAFQKLNIPPNFRAANIANRDKIKEICKLNSLINDDVDLKDAMDSEIKRNHILSKRVNFKKLVVDQIANFYLSMLNQVLWIDDQYDNFIKKPIDYQNMGNMIPYRWRRSGVSLSSAVKLMVEMTGPLSFYFEALIKSRFNPDIIEERLAIDFSNVKNQYALNLGGYKKNKNNNDEKDI